MKGKIDPKSLALRILLTALILTGIYVLLIGHNTTDARIIQYQEKFFNKGWFYYDKEGNEIAIDSLPVHIQTDGMKSAIFHRLTEFEDGRTSVCFYSQHQNVKLKLNNQIIYEYKTEAVPKTIMSYRPVYNFTDLPPIPAGSLLCIETEAVIPSSAGDYEEVFFGDTAQILFTILLKHINSFLLGVMFIVISVLLFGTHHLFSHTNKKDYTLLHLALLTFTIGVWQLDDSTLLLFFTGYLPLLWCCKYLSQLFIPIFTYFFVKSISPKTNSKFLNVFFWITIAAVAVEYILQITGIKAITNTLFISHFIYLTACIYTLRILFKEDWIKVSKLKYLFIGSMILSTVIFAFTAISMFNNKFFSSMMSFGLAFTFISMILITYQKELKLFEEMNLVNMYKHLAFVDIATGVNNKTAWYTLVENFNETTRPQGEYCMIVFDMNNLKKLNDNFGHLIGDKVIKSFCECLIKIFGTNGAIYRIGGDEFVCICHNISREKVQKLLQNFDESVLTQEETEHKFSAAYGYEFFTPHSPADFNKALNAADEKMYNAKVAMKAARE